MMKLQLFRFALTLLYSSLGSQYNIVSLLQLHVTHSIDQEDDFWFGPITSMSLSYGPSTTPSIDPMVNQPTLTPGTVITVPTSAPGTQPTMGTAAPTAAPV
jgi:hypothetical protein